MGETVTQSKQQLVDILNEHKALLYKIVSLYARDDEDRKDLEQEITIQIWRSLKSFDSDYKLSTWIYRVALNAAISHLRKESRRRDQLEPLHESIFTLSEEEAQAQHVTEQSKLLHTFISQLDELNKALMILYLEEKSYKEIAQILGISESNVGTKIGRIKILLREKFQQAMNH